MKKMKKLYCQHGDVCLEIVKEIPKKARRVPLKGNSFTVEKGEGGHTHDLIGSDLGACVEVFKDNDSLYLRTKKVTTITHEEHGKKTLVPGKIYKKHIEREWDYESEEARNTAD